MNGDYSHEIKAFAQDSMTNLDSMLKKQRHAF